MQRTLDQTALKKQMEGVADKLADSRLSTEKRLELLRRQAHLGDLRDAIAKRAARSTERRMGAN